MRKLRPNEGRAGRTSRLPSQGSSAVSPATPGVIARFVIDGQPSRVPEDISIADATAFAQEQPDGMALFLYLAPTPDEIAELATAWKLHPLLLEDLVNARQRPKLERYGDALFLVARSARYIDETEEVDFAEFHVLVRPNAVAVLCQDERWIDGTNGARFHEQDSATLKGQEGALLTNETLLRLGPEAVVYRLLDAIVDGYAPVLRGVSIDKEQIERQVFSGDAAVAERIYRLSQEVIDMQQAISSLTEVLDGLRGGFVKYDIPDELRSYLDDLADHLRRAATQISDLRVALAQILNVNATLVAQRQNEDMKKISGWAAILFAPTLIGAIYGMNFDDMPELHWTFGYPMAIGLMVGLGVLLYVIFKRSKWM
nr:magnesium and cobalt transport protein CorA [Rarobacter faecitabidus]